MEIQVLFWLLIFNFPVEGLEGPGFHDENRERKSDFENSEDERRRSKIGNLKKKAISASNKFTHSLKKRGKRKIDYRVPPVPIEDVRDANEESAVCELRQKLIDRDLLPPRHDDYHTLLRSVISFSIYNVLHEYTGCFGWLVSPFTWTNWVVILFLSLADFWKLGTLTSKKQSWCGKKCSIGEKNMERTLFWR